MDRVQLANRIGTAAKLEGHFELRSGATASTYFDKYQFESDPELLNAVAREMAGLLPTDTDIIAGLELGGIPIVTALSHVTGLPAAFVRKEAKRYGTAKRVEGPSLDGRRVVLIEDVVSTGGALLDALDYLESVGVRPVAAVCVVDRQLGGDRALAARRVELRAVFRFDELG